MLFLKVPALSACDEGKHLEFISILKDGFHPLQEFDGSSINHQSDVWKNRVRTRFIEVGGQRVSPLVNHQGKEVFDSASLWDGQLKFPLSADLFQFHDGVDFDLDHSLTRLLHT